jgi:hypothetical protein
VRYSWSLEGLDQVRAQGLTPGEVHEALAGPGRRLRQAIDGRTLRIVGSTAESRLIEVWLRESDEDHEWDVWIAFDAGSVATAQWKNAFGGEQ